MSSNRFGSSDLDLRPPPMIRMTMECWIQECPHCHYVAKDLSHPPSRKRRSSDATYQQLLSNEQFPPLARRFLASSHYFDEGSESAAMACLHAAWICDDAQKNESASECRRQAAEHLEYFRPLFAEESHLTKGAVLVDILRRSGRFEQAIQDCETLLLGEQIPDSLRQVLVFQRKLSEQQDVKGYPVSDAVKTQT